MSKISQYVLDQQLMLGDDPDYLVYTEQYDEETIKQMDEEYADYCPLEPLTF